MPTVTGLDPVKRRSGWIEVQLDGALFCVLPDEEVWKLGLREGVEIADSALEDVRRAGEHAEAMRIGLRYLSVRPRSCRELERRLRRNQIDPAVTAQVVDRFVDLGYLDDAEFAAAFARDRIRLKPCGTRRMRSDLIGKGVSPADADRGIRSAMTEEDVTETQLLERVASARAARLTTEPEVSRRRLFGYLARRGFSPSSIRAWIEREWPDEDARRV